MIEFVEFPKMARLSREVIVSEKIDGTNAQVFIDRVPLAMPPIESEYQLAEHIEVDRKLVLIAGSRSRYLSRATDNFGFAKWVQEHAEELFALGAGRHFGEWWGSGVQRGYGLPKGEKRFSLFNTDRWIDTHEPLSCGEDLLERGKVELAPKCCHVVPILWRGLFDTQRVVDCVEKLRTNGSYAAPGFMNAEGVVVFHTAGHVGFKKTLLKDESPKSLAG